MKPIPLFLSSKVVILPPCNHLACVLTRGIGIKRDFNDVAELANEQNADETMALDDAISRLKVAEPLAAQISQCGS